MKVEFTAFYAPGEARMKYVYPRTPCRNFQVAPHKQQRCTFISFVMLLVSVIVPGVVLVAAVASVNIAISVVGVGKIARAIHKRPPQTPIN